MFAGKIGVHENVCAKMREKLVSEVKVNIQKLKVKQISELILSSFIIVNKVVKQNFAHRNMIFFSHFP